MSEASADAPLPDVLHELHLLIRSRYPLILLDTAEEDRAEGLLRHLADRLELPFYVWTRTKGLRKMELADDFIAGTSEPSAALKIIEGASFAAVYHLQGFGPLLANDDLAARLKDVAAAFARQGGAAVITGEGLAAPEPIRPHAAALRLPPPGAEDYKSLLRRILRDVAARMTVKVTLSAGDVERIVANVRGLTLLEAEKIFTKVIVEDGRLAPDDVRKVIDAKKTVVEREGLLEYTPAEEAMRDIAGLDGLKAWLAKRKAIVAEPKRAAEFGLSFPRGILLIGVQGCGKSLCAKAVAMEWGLPLLKLDPSNLYNKYIGQSEQNFKRAMRVAEQMAPVVLWIDEIEKAFAQGGEEDGGVSQRVLGTFLSWMQDRKGDVFVIATANNVEKLPPELIRKGRFDEMFFVDLPDVGSRREIFRIHLARRKQDPAKFDLAALAGATEGFSGAEIEQAVVSGLYTAFAGRGGLTTRGLLDEAALTKPLSVTMAEKVARLRAWAKGRTVAAQ